MKADALKTALLATSNRLLKINWFAILATTPVNHAEHLVLLAVPHVGEHCLHPLDSGLKQTHLILQARA